MHPVRVLVVEDALRLAVLLKRGLEEAGYAVDVADNGGDALDRASRFAYDLIVLDVMLPDLDGIEICRRLRSDQRRVPVLMLTARDSVQDRTQGFDAGADDYLTKPFTFGELYARIRALIPREVVS